MTTTLTDAPPQCPYCHTTMQFFSKRYQGDKLVQVTFMCACQETIYYQNIHNITEKNVRVREH